MKKFLQKIMRSTTAHPIWMLAVFFILGIIFWGGFNTAMEATNNEAFCISCHEMQNNVYLEYKNTVHYQNRTGVRATCPDCHVPRSWPHMFARKVKATNELYHKVIGSIDTREKFEAKRLQLAEYVWKSMKSTDSRECRNCHSFAYMELSKQHTLSQRKHARSLKANMTCIDCHMGIAHHLPKTFDADGKIHEGFKKNKRPCNDCHKDMAWSEDQ